MVHLQRTTCGCRFLLRTAPDMRDDPAGLGIAQSLYRSIRPQFIDPRPQFREMEQSAYLGSIKLRRFLLYSMRRAHPAELGL